MKITEKKVDNSNMLLEIKMTESDYLDSVNAQLSNAQKKMNIPGFRIGKVPMGLVKKKYELSIKVEEINKLILQLDRQDLIDYFISIGFSSVSIDLEGFISGKLNRNLEQ